MNKSELKKMIQDAEMVLVGIGEELESGFSILESSQIYEDLKRKLKAEGLAEENYEWVYPCLLQQAEKESEEARLLSDFYFELKDMLGDKNYFIISMNMDSMLEETGFSVERYVQPFGNYELLQCDRGCTKELKDAGEMKENGLHSIRSGTELLASLKKSYCPHCGSEMVFNNVNAGNYLEEGYLENWKRYTKWIEGTMNRKVCILELGVMLNYPSMIRWPFEKLGYLNQKASFVRMNSVIPQLTEELAGKGISVRTSSINFFLER